MPTWTPIEFHNVFAETTILGGGKDSDSLMKFEF